MKENDGQITIGTKNYELVDMPGHERIRSRYTDFLPVTRSIVFVLDSTSLNRQIRSVAEYLYDILANSRVQKQRIPVLIACNKSDMITALPVDKIQLMLESEIRPINKQVYSSNRLRATRTARVEQQASEGDEEEAYLGYEGEDFKFQHLDNRVEFGQCSVEKDKLEEIKDWIVR
ncbi:signal recognition particle receptor, beta subunit [Pilobolus umbonatus]|nr:signal recognition particle receptor, beta subunit [Pilobolus umbonatus]